MAHLRSTVFITMRSPRHVEERTQLPSVTSLVTQILLMGSYFSVLAMIITLPQFIVRYYEYN
jgi:hypothetical protein